MIVLETDRLILRTWDEADIDPMTEINQDPQVCEFLPGVGNRMTTETMIHRYIKYFNDHRYSLYAVELKNDHELIGFLGLISPSFEAHFTPAVEIGWRLAPKHWNKGYATEGAQAALRHGFNQFKLKEIVSFTVVANRASRRVMEKIGMRHDPKDDFNHPNIANENPLQRHVLYRLSQVDYLNQMERH